MNWAEGLMVWIVGGGIVCWIVALILERVGPADNTDHDWLADRKRRIERRASVNRYTHDPRR